MLMLITYYVCIYIIKRVIKYMGTAGYSHGSVKLKQLSQLWSGEALLTLFFSAWYCYKHVKKDCMQAKEKRKREFTAWPGKLRLGAILRWQCICWPNGAYPAICGLYVSDREPRVRIIIIHIIVCFFGVLFFYASNQHSEGDECEWQWKGNEGDEGDQKDVHSW